LELRQNGILPQWKPVLDHYGNKGWSAMRISRSLAPMATEKANNKARVFFALWPGAAECAALADWQPPLHQLCGGRIMRAETLHTTLVFLGDVERQRLEALQLAAQEVRAKACQLIFDGARYWGHNHILYAAASSVPPQLQHLVSELERHLALHHFQFDKRPYKPHVTLLRNAHWSDKPLPAMRHVTWQVRDFALVQSAPDEQGANYQVLARFALGLRKH
jgi:RNA 2',3'-cyclic 3'-phosphodiesterase